MRHIKLDSKIKISDLPVTLSRGDIQNELKGCLPGEWALFEISKSHQYFIGYANPFAENHKILRLIKESSLDILKVNEEKVIQDILEEYIAAAFTKREFYKGILGPCCRMFYGDQDGLPGLIIDKYCNAIVLQINTAGMDRHEKVITSYLKKCFDLPILYFENSYLRKSELLPVVPKVPETLRILEINDNDLLIKIPVLDLQKAGFYFDHSYNRLKLIHLLNDLKLQELKVLDLFCYAGAWGFSLLKRGLAKYVHFVDQGDFVKSLDETAKCNSISQERFKFTRDDVFKFLDNHDEEYDLIICDPPAFAKGANKISHALEGYKKIFHQCLGRTKKNGILVAASCTHGVSLEDLSRLISIEGSKAHRKLVILDLGTQRMDHPLSSLSGSAFYLKYICYHVS